MRRLSYLVTLSFLALLMLVPTAGAHSQKVVTVSIRDFFFDPARITVASGTTVMWVNEGNHPHTVTADDRSFDSEVLNPGDSFMVRFRRPGKVSYHCEIHPFMKGSVTAGKNGGAATAVARAGGAMAKVGAGGAVAKIGGS